MSAITRKPNCMRAPSGGRRQDRTARGQLPGNRPRLAVVLFLWHSSPAILAGETCANLSYRRLGAARAERAAHRCGADIHGAWNGQTVRLPGLAVVWPTGVVSRGVVRRGDRGAGRPVADARAVHAPGGVRHVRRDGDRLLDRSRTEG